MKPTSLMIRDGEKDIINAINNTQLPPCIVKLILEKIENQVNKLCYEEEQRDIQEYKEELKTQENRSEEK